MRAVVTGGAGFIGSHLLEALTRRGDQAVCVERRGASRRWIAGLPVTVHECGVADADCLAAAMRGADIVFHLAALTEARSPEDFYAVNTEGTASVMRAAASFGSAAPRVILVSSLAALGPCRSGAPLDEDAVPHPLSAYGRSKLLAEAVVHAYADRVPATILRLPTVYGPRERAVLKFFQLVRRGVALTIGDWDRALTLLHVQDLVAGLLRVAETPASVGRTYILSHPEAVTWRAFAETVGRALGRVPVLLSVPVPVARVIARTAELVAAAGRRAAILNRERLREMTQRSWLCSTARAAAELGFAPQVPAAIGIPVTAAWYREAGWL